MLVAVPSYLVTDTTPGISVSYSPSLDVTTWGGAFSPQYGVVVSFGWSFWPSGGDDGSAFATPVIVQSQPQHGGRGWSFSARMAGDQRALLDLYVTGYETTEHVAADLM